MHNIGEGAEAVPTFDPLLHTAIEPLHEAPAPALRDPSQPLRYNEYLTPTAAVTSPRPTFRLLQGGLSEATPPRQHSTIHGLEAREAPDVPKPHRTHLIDATNLSRAQAEADFTPPTFRHTPSKLRRIGYFGLVAGALMIGARSLFRRG